MNPKQIEKITDPQRIAIAPYNFVELPEKVVAAEPLPAQNFYHEYSEHLVNGETVKIKRYTGRIECTLTTKSKLYTRCGWSPEDFAKHGEDTFKDLPDEIKKLRANFFINPATQELIIPGSSIRGMLRTLVEIVSFSKIERVTDNKLFYRSLGDPALKAIYCSNFVESLGDVQHSPDPKAPCYRAKVRAGFLRKDGNSYIIEECSYGRIHFDIHNSKQSVIRTLSHNQLYQSIRGVKTPMWKYQQQPIYVQIDQHEQDYFFQAKQKEDKDGNKIYKKNGDPDWRHPDLYLRYRAVRFAGFTQSRPNLKQATLVITGDMKHKHLEFAFLDGNLKEYQVSEEIIKRFQDDDQITKWQEKAYPKDKPSRGCRQQDGYLRDKGKEPVFFLLNDDGETVRFLGRAQMFRLPYEHSPLDFVPPQLRDASCTDIAEAIFGYVGGKEPRETARASRVLITDGILKPNQEPKVQSSLYKNPEPILLSSPKPTTFQHYLVQPKETKADKRNLKHYASKPPTDTEPGETVIRGHKLYWHKPFKMEVPANADTQISLVKPIEPDIDFSFKVYFENLSDVELGALLWILKKTDKPEYCLALGMGKPIGMGKIKVKIEKLWLSDSTRTSRYKKLFTDNNQWESGETSNTMDQGKNCIKAFENYILSHIDNKDRAGARALDELQRIRMLLEMLRCDGLPNSKDADYMTLESKQYQDRRVLPTPLQVSNRQAKKVEPPNKKAPKSRSESGGTINLALERTKKQKW